MNNNNSYQIIKYSCIAIIVAALVFVSMKKSSGNEANFTGDPETGGSSYTSDTTYGGNDEPDSDTYSDIHGSDDCTSDCSGHDAGYDWGEEHDICDTDYSGGNSNSFDEGVQAYAEDNC